MAIKVVDPDAPSRDGKIVRIYRPLPLLPKEEAVRMRRATRNAADSMAPWALQEMISLAESTDDGELKFKILDRILKLSLAGKSNEEVDPEAPTIDGEVVSKELEALERATENSGTGDE